MRRERLLYTVLFLAPALLLVGVFMLWPAVTAFTYSLYDWTSFQRGEFVGLENFQRLLGFPFANSFFRALGHNAGVFIAIVLVQTVLALALAYALWRQPPGLRFFRTTVFLPVILSLVVTAFLWQMFLHPLFGPLTKVMMNTFHLSSFAPLGDTRLALGTAIIISIWKNVGFPTLVFLSGMNNVPDELYEAATLDGATPPQLFRFITLPLLGPAFTIIVLLTFIGSFEWFELPFVLGGPTGNPAGALDTLALMFYRFSFGDGSSAVSDVGLGSAVSVILFTLVLIGSKYGADYLRRREIGL